MDQVQSPEANQPPLDESALDKITNKMQERALEALDDVPIGACKRLIDVIEANQLDLAMASITAEWDPQQRLIDQGKFEAMELFANQLRAAIHDKRRENREEHQ